MGAPGGVDKILAEKPENYLTDSFQAQVVNNLCLLLYR